MGRKWIPEQDLLTLRGGRETRKGELHKRDVLSDVQSFFDPIGYTSPFILKSIIDIPRIKQDSAYHSVGWKSTYYYRT